MHQIRVQECDREILLFSDPIPLIFIMAVDGFGLNFEENEFTMFF